MKPYLLIADLDLTLLGDDVALKRFVDWHRTRTHWLKLVYASGRLHAAVRKAIDEHGLPAPEAIICGVGTEVWPFGSGTPLPGWTDHFPSGWSAARVRVALGQFHQLQLQPDRFQSPYKVSYYARWLRPAQFEWLRSALRAHRVPAELVYSSNRDLDVLPAGVNKGTAAAYLVRHLRWPGGNVLVAGDSGNDLAMFRRGFRGIVVANAHHELKAVEGCDVYVSSFPFAEGVLDGLHHWLDEKPSWRNAG